MCVCGHNCSCIHWDKKCRCAETFWEWLRDLNHTQPTSYFKNLINAILKYRLALGLYLFSKDLLILDNTVQKPLLNSSIPTYPKICVLVLNCSFKMCKKSQNIFLSTKVYKIFISDDIARQMWRTRLQIWQLRGSLIIIIILTV